MGQLETNLQTSIADPKRIAGLAQALDFGGREKDGTII